MPDEPYETSNHAGEIDAVEPVDDAKSQKAFLMFMIRHRHWFLGAGHILLFAIAYLGAYLLRFDFRIPQDYWNVFLVTLPGVIVVKLTVFIATGHIHGWLRIVTFRDLLSVAGACLLSLVALAAADFFTVRISIPRSVLVLDAIMTLFIVGAIRSSWRLFAEVVRPIYDSALYSPAILIGTDSETVFLAGQIRSYGRLPLQVCGLIEPDEQVSRYESVGGFRVLGGLSDIESVAVARRIRVVLVHTEMLPGKRMRELMETCERLDIHLQIVPRFEDRMTGTGRIPTRDIRIDDLLGRAPARLDLESIREMVEGKCVLVTGAGGSIGSEICRQLMHYEPETLVLLGRGENRIYEIDRELRSWNSKTNLKTVIADIRDAARMDEVFFEHGPHLVFHAAAHKHVPLMESNVREAVINNVIGTQTVAAAADKFGAKRFVMISSDKAVRPTSVMGATKRMAEMAIQAIGGRSKTKFMTVRFGNVLGSAGSVVPLFKQQIENGGPITITDERMTRFFMTIPEASQLVMQAAAMGQGGDLFVLDMGTPIRIVDLARDMIRLCGLPQDAIEIVFSGARPGEKMHEELADDGNISSTSHPKILSVQPLEFDEAYLNELTAQLMSSENTEAQIRSTLLELGRTTFAQPSAIEAESSDAESIGRVSTGNGVAS